jgi:hypothetical protein
MIALSRHTPSASASFVQLAGLTDTTRSGTIVAGTGLGIVAAVAFPSIGIPLAALRSYGISLSLQRIGSKNGCRGQDAAEVPEFLNSPLGFGMLDGKDYVTGMAVGAPLVVLISGIVGAVFGCAMHLFSHYVWSPLRARFIRSIETKTRRHDRRNITFQPLSASMSVAEAAAAPAAARGSDQREKRDLTDGNPAKTFADIKIQLAAAAAGGAAQFVNAAASIVTQPAVAAAVLRAAEGPVDGTPAWYPAAAVVCALLSFVPMMVALWSAWPRPPSISRRRGITNPNHLASTNTHLIYRVRHCPLSPLPAAEMLPGGLRAAGRRYMRDDGEWRLASTRTSAPPVPPSVTTNGFIEATLTEVPNALGASAYRIFAGNNPVSASTRAVHVGEELAAMIFPLPESSEDGIEQGPMHQRPDQRRSDSTTAQIAPAERAPKPAGGWSDASLAASAAWRQALFCEFRGHARFAAQFLVASQALQGLAQAAGELAPDGGGGDMGAKQSCVASTAAQLAFMVLYTAVLVRTKPQSSRQNFDSEVIPTWRSSPRAGTMLVQLLSLDCRGQRTLARCSSPFSAWA